MEGIAGRTTIRVVIALVLTAGLSHVPAGAEGSTRTVGKRYVGGEGTPWMSIAWCDLGPVSVAAVCLGRTSDEQITVAIDDGSGRRVGGHFEITDGNGNTLFLRPFCGTIGPIEPPPGVLHIHLDGAKSLPSCPLPEVSYATTGRVDVTFSS